MRKATMQGAWNSVIVLILVAALLFSVSKTITYAQAQDSTISVQGIDVIAQEFTQGETLTWEIPLAGSLKSLAATGHAKGDIRIYLAESQLDLLDEQYPLLADQIAITEPELSNASNTEKQIAPHLDYHVVSTEPLLASFSIENSTFNWDKNTEHLCTRWSITPSTTASITECFGDSNCCDFLGLSSSDSLWSAPLYLPSSYALDTENTLGAQIHSIDYNLSLEDAYVDIVSSPWITTQVTYQTTQEEFVNHCDQTCALNVKQDTLTLIIELGEGASLYLDSLHFEVEQTILAQDSNNPPFARPIPNYTIANNDSLQVNLSHYFVDPDNDPLTYSSYQPQDIEVAIDNEVVSLTPARNLSEVRYIFFRANDSFAVAVSNIVVLNITDHREEQTITTELSQQSAEVGKPVRWTKTVSYSELVNGTTVDLDSGATDITITAVDEQQATSLSEQDILVKQRYSTQTLEAYKKAKSQATRVSSGAEENITIELTKQANNYIVEYSTPAPTKTEFEPTHSVTEWKKEVQISSPYHYQNILSTTSIEEVHAHQISLFWIIDGKRVDVTQDENIDLRLVDTNQNGLIDKLVWNVPHLSTQTFEVLLSLMDLRISSGSAQHNWTVVFNTTEHTETLSANIISTDSQLSFNSLFFYNESTTSWESFAGPITQQGQNISVTWNGSAHERGMIIYDISVLDRYKLNLTFGNLSSIAENNDYYHQRAPFLLNLTNPLFTFELCRFNHTFWECDPLLNASSYDIGYFGEDVLLEQNTTTYYMLIPKNATVNSANFSLVPIPNTSIQTHSYSGGFSDTTLTIGDLSTQDINEIIIASDTTLSIWNSSSTTAWTYTSPSTIADVDSANLFDGSAYDEIVISTDQNLIVLASNGTHLWNLSNNYIVAALGRVINRFNETINDDSQGNQVACIGCNEQTAQYRLPYNITSDSTLCLIRTPLNYKGNNTNNLTVTINGTLYDVDESLITVSNILNYNQTDSTAEDSICIGCDSEQQQRFNLHFGIPNPIPAQECYVFSALNYKGNNTNNLTLSANGTTYDVDQSLITIEDVDIIFSQDDSDANAVECIGCNSSAKRFTIPYNLSNVSNSACQLNIPLNYVSNKSNNLTFVLNGTLYDIDENEIEVSNILNYNNTDGSSENYSCIGCSSEQQQRFNTYFDIPNPIPAQECFVASALSYVGNNTNNLSLSVNGTSYDVDEAQIITNTTLRYAISGSDNTSEHVDCIGCSTDQLTFVLGFDIPDPIPAASCYVRAGICYNTSNNGVLRMSITDVGTQHYPLVTQSCDSNNLSYVDINVSCSDLVQGRSLQFSCISGCNSTDNYQFFGDNSTNTTNSSYFNGISNIDPGVDYLISIHSNDSLLFNWTHTPVACSDLANATNITYSCSECSDLSHYRLLSDNSTSNHSFVYDGSSWSTLQSRDHMAYVFSNTSLLHNFTTTTVNCSDLAMDANLTFFCSSCDENAYYNIIADSSISGNSFENSTTWNSLSSDFMIRAQTNTLDFAWISTEVACADLVASENLTYQCSNCNDSHHYNLLLDSNSSGNSYSYNGSEWSSTSMDPMVYLFSNTSLLHSFVTTEINCTDLASDVNITYTCNTCNQDAYYHLIADDSVSGNSYLNETIALSADFMIRISSLLSTESDIVAADGFDTIHVYNYSQAEIWNYTFSSDIYDIVISDLDQSSVGNEILVGSLGAATLLNSSGSVLWSETFGSSKVQAVDIGRIGSDLLAVLGLNNGQLYLCDSEGTCTLNYTASSAIVDLSVSDVKNGDNKEIVASLSNGNLLVFGSSITLLNTFGLSSGLGSLATGEVHSFGGIEISVVTKDNLVSVLNINDPQNITISIGDTYLAWNITTSFNETLVANGSDLVSAFNNYLNSCTSSTCNVAINFSSSEQTRFNVQRPVIQFTYNATNTIDYAEATLWSKSDEIIAGDTYYYQALNLSYPNLPALPLHVQYVLREDLSITGDTLFNEVVCGYNDSQLDLGYTSDLGLPLGCDKDYYISDSIAKESDFWWYNLSSNDTPIVMNNTLTSADGFNQYNLSLYRSKNLTTQQFTNVIANFSVNDSLIVNSLTFEVDWFDNGTYIDITPTNTTSTCNTTSPTLERIFVSNYSFEVCKQDLDSDSLVDYVKWKQPLLNAQGENFSNVSYRLRDSALQTLNLSIRNASEDIFRTTRASLEAELIDENGDFVNLSGQNCSWYVGTTNIGNSSTVEGVCTMLWNTTCSSNFIPNAYTLSVNLEANNSYATLNASSPMQVIDNLNFSMSNPNGSISVDFNDIVSLTSRAVDSCGDIDSSLESTITWKDNLGWSNTGINATYVVTTQTGVISLTQYPTHPYYVNVTNGTGFMELGDSIKISLLSTGPHYRTASAQVEENFEIRAQIHTGEDIAINDSEFNDTNNWANYSCDWYVNSAFVNTTNTTENTGECRFQWNASCSNATLGSHTFSVILRNNSQLPYNFSIGGNESSQSMNLIDSGVIVDVTSPANNTRVYYADTVTLNVSVNDSCGISNQSYTTTWAYADEDTAVNLGTVDNWFVGAFAYGEANLTAQVSHTNYNSSSNVSYFEVWRETALNSLEAPDNPPKYSIVNVTCEVNITGLTNKSGYNVTFTVDENYTNPLVRQTNESGIALLEWDTTGLAEGPHLLECNISDDVSQFFNASSVETEKHKEKTVVIPTDLIISAHFADSRELNLAQCSHYISNTTVFRTATSTWGEPDLLWLGANVSTVWNSTGELLPMDNVTVHFNIVNVTNHKEMVAQINCVTNLTEFNNRPANPPTYAFENLCDSYYNDFVCYTNWNASQSVPVGNYTLLINASRPGNWTTSNVTVNISVLGLIDIEINSTVDTSEAWSDENLTIWSRVVDDAGNLLGADEVNVTYYNDGCTSSCVENTLGNGSGDNFTLIWDIWGAPLTENTDCRDANWRVWALAQGQNYVRAGTVSQENPEISSCEEYTNRDIYDVSDPEIYHKTEVVMTSPSSEVTDFNTTNGDLNFTCVIRRVNDSLQVDDGYPVNFTCAGCQSPDNQEEKSINTNLNGQGLFGLNFSNETTGSSAYYNFSCLYQNNSYYRLANTTDGNHTRNIKVVQNLGGGGGACDFDGICDIADDENCVSCPEDCDFDVHLYNITNGTQGEQNPGGNACFCIQKINTTYYNYSYPDSADDPDINISDGTCDSIYEKNTCFDCSAAGGVNFAPTVTEVYSSTTSVDCAGTNADYYVQPNTTLYISAKVTDPNPSDTLTIWLENQTDPGNPGIGSMSANGCSDRYEIAITVLNTSVYTVVGQDDAGSQDRENVTVTVDLAAPIITEVNISTRFVSLNGTPFYNNGSSIDVNVTLEEDNNNISSVTAEGVTFSYVGSNKWSGSVVADLNDTVINITVTDNAGYTTTNATIYAVDDTAPSVAILTPTDNALLSQNQTFNVTINDTVGDNDSYQYRIYNGSDGTEWTNLTHVPNTPISEWIVTLNTTNITDGIYNFSIRANDSVGNENSSEYITITIDNTAPRVSITNPSEGSFLKGNQTFNITIIEDLENYYNETYEYRLLNGSIVSIDWTRLNASSNTSWYVTLNTTPYNDGNYTFLVRVNDSLNNTNMSQSINISIDNHLPEVSIILPSTGQNISSILTINASVLAGDILGVSTVEYNITNASGPQAFGRMEQVINTDYWVNESFDVSTLGEGNYTVSIKATDFAGNINDTESVTVTFDAKAPLINVTTPLNGTIVAGSVTLNATVNESGVGIDAVQWNNGSAQDFTSVISNFYTTSIDTTGYEDGNFTFNVTANDTLGNENEVAFVINIDNNAPSLNITSPITGDFISKTTRFNVTIDDEAGNGDPTAYLYRLYNGSDYVIGFSALSGSGTDWYVDIDTTSYTSGNYSFIVNANDTLDNENISFVNITITNTLPNVTIVFPDSDADINGTVMLQANITTEFGNADNSTFQFRVEDYDETVHFSYTAFNVSCGVDAYCYEFDTTALKDNFTYTLRVRANDTVGNQRIASVNFSIDNDAPRVSIVFPENNTNVSGAEFFNATIVDFANNRNNESYNYTLDGVVTAGFDGNVSDLYYVNINWAVQPEGSYLVGVVANDTFNRTNNSEFITITVDYTNPLVTITSPDHTITNGTLDVNATISDSVTGVENYNATINNGSTENVVSGFSCTAGSCSGQYDSTTLADGNFTVFVSAQDHSGNVNKSNITITVDNDVPLITFTQPPNAIVVKENKTINVTIVDQLGLPATFNWAITNSTSTQVSVWNSLLGSLEDWYLVINTSLHPDGNYTIWSQASDLSKTANTTLNITIDNTAPIIHSLQSNDTDNISRSGAILNFIVVVNDSNIANVTLNGTFMQQVGYQWYTENSTSQFGCSGDGECLLTANATDHAGSFQTTIYNITIDDSTSSVLYALPTEENGTYFNRDWIFVNITVNETNEKNVTFWLFNSTDLVNETTFGPGNRSINFTSLDSNEAYNYNVTVRDFAGNENTTLSRYITLDSTNPSIHTLESNDEENISRSDVSLVFSVNATDTNIGNVTLNGTFMSNSDLWTSSNTTAEFGCSATSCTFNATVIDRAGNRNSTTYTITIDETIPAINYGLLTEPNATYFARDWIFVNVSTNDTNEANITFLLANNTDTVNQTTFTNATRELNFTSLDSNADYYYNVTITDLADNLNYTQTRKITLDTTNPSVDYSGDTSSNNTYASRDWIFVEISVTETNPSNLTFSLSNTTDLVNQTTLGAGNISINFTGLDSNEQYSYNVTYRDLAANANTTANRIITLDTTSPSISSLFSNDTNNISRSDALLNFSVTVSDSNILNVSVNGTSMTQTGTLWYIERTPTQIGCASDENCSIVATAQDQAGNINTTLYELVVDDTLPLVEYSDPTEEDSTFHSRSWIFINVSASDLTEQNISFVLYNTSGFVTESNFSDGTRSVNFTSLNDDMQYTYNVTLIDGADNSNTTPSRTITLDGTNPSIANLISSDSDNVSQSSAILNFSVTVSDTNIANVTLNGTPMQQTGTTWYTLNASDDFSCSSDGNCTFSATAVDHAGNTNSTTYLLIVDNSPPSVISLQTNDTDNVTTSSANLNFTVNATDINIDTVVLNGTHMIQDADLWYTPNTTAQFGCSSDGNCTFSLNATDLAGSSNITTYTITIDETIPLIHSLNSSDNNDIVRSDVAINFTVNSTDSHLLSVSLNGTFMLQNGDIWYTQNTTAQFGCSSDGNCTFNATSLDLADNINSTLYTLVVDDTIPTIDYSNPTPANNTYYSQNWIFLNTTATDTNEANITFNLHNTTNQLNATTLPPGNRTINFTNLPSNQPYHYNITIQDLADNQNNTQTRTITLDTTNPQIHTLQTNDPDNITRSDTPLNFTLNATDTNIANVTLNGTTMQQNAQTWYTQNTTTQLGCPTDGNCTFTATVTDLAGNQNTTTHTLTIDNTEPNIHSLSSDDLDNVSTSTKSLNFTVNATDSNIVSVVLNGTHMIQSGDIWHTQNTTADFGCSSDGNCTLVANATDVVGNNKTDSYTITVDDTNPTIDYSNPTPANNTYYSQNWIFLNTTATDTNEANITFNLHNTTNQLNATTLPPGNRTINFTNLPSNQPYHYNITIQDLADNQNNTQTRTITLDTTNPQIHTLQTNDPDNITRSDTPLNFTLNATDTNIANVTLNGTTMQQNAQTWYTQNTTTQLGCPTDGNCTFTATVTDLAGNQNTTTHTLTIDNTNPLIHSLSSDDADTLASSGAQLNFTVNATDINLANVSLNGTLMQQNGDIWYTLNTSGQIGCSSSSTRYNCTMQALIVDKAGNSNTTTYTIEIDDTNVQVHTLNATNALDGTAQTNFIKVAFPETNVSWNVTISTDDNDNFTVFLYSNATAWNGNTVEMVYSGFGDIYQANTTPLHLNLTNGTYHFFANATDAQGNSNVTFKRLVVTADSPIITNITAQKSFVEIYQNITLSFFLNSSVSVKLVNLTVEYGSQTESFILPNATGQQLFNFTPSVSGQHNVSVSATNTADQTATLEAEEVFLVVGTTDATLEQEAQSCTNCTLSTLQFDNITQESKATLQLNLSFRNIGNVTMRNVTIGQLGTLTGLSYLPLSYDCGTLTNGSSCNTTIDINISSDAAIDEISIVSLAFWNNPDNSTGFVSNITTIEVLSHPQLEVLDENVSSDRIAFNTTQTIGNFSVESFGNAQLENITFSILDGNISASDITFAPSNISALAQGEITDILVNLSIDEIGYHNATILVNATGNTCVDQKCSDTFYVNTSVYGWLNVSLENVTETVVYRDEEFNATLVTNVTFIVNATANSLGAAVENSTILFIHNDTTIGSCLTNSSGRCSFLWNPNGSIPAGNNTITFKATKDNSHYDNSSSATTTLLIQNHVMPRWITQSASLSINLTTDYTLDLICAINESSSNEPVFGYNVTMYRVLPATFNATSFGEDDNWSNNGSNGNVSSLSTTLNITTTSSHLVTLETAKQSELDTLALFITNISANTQWNLSYRTDEGWVDVINSSNETTYELNITNRNITAFGFGIQSTSGSDEKFIWLDNITLEEEAVYTSAVEIANGQILRENDTNASGSMENVSISTENATFNSTGWFLENANYTFIETAKQGNYSLVINYSEVSDPIRLTAQFYPYLNLSDYKRLAFFLYSDGKNNDTQFSINLTQANETGNATCSYEIDFNHSEEWNYYNPSFVNFSTACAGDPLLDKLEFIITPTESNVTGVFYLDDVQLMQQLVTNDLGVASVDWYPPSDGNFRILCNISDQEYYNVSTPEALLQLSLTDIGAGDGDSGENESGADEGDDDGGADTGSSSGGSSSGSSAGGGGGGGGGGSAAQLPNVCGDGFCSDLETLDSCPQDCSPTLRLFETCGNSICDLGENADNCPVDCAAAPYSFETTLKDPKLKINEQKEYTIELYNNINETIFPEITISGSEIKRFLEITENNFALLPGESKKVIIKVKIEGDEKPAIYNGDIIVNAGGIERIIPLTLTVAQEPFDELSIDVDILNKVVTLGSKIKAHVSILNPYAKVDDLSLKYRLKNAKTGEVVYVEKEQLELGDKKSFIKELDIETLVKNAAQAITGNFVLEGEELKEGEYIIEIVHGEEGDEIVLATDTFSIVKPFWSPQRKQFALVTFLLVSLISSSVYGVHYYKKRKKEKARYLFPTSTKLLPQRDERSIYMGKIAETKHNMWWNPDDLTTHALVAGATGAGKSVTASIFVEGILKKKIPAIIFDPTAQWTGFVKPCKDQNLIKKYSEFGMNQDDARSFKGLIYDVDTPNIELDFKAWMNPGEVTVFNLNKLKAGEYDQAVNHIVDTIFNIKWEESTELKMLVIFDEVHRLLPKYGGEGGYLALERACREFRKWGIGLIMVSQVNADFKEALQGNILTEVQLNTKSIEDIKKMQQKYGQEYAQRISREGVGVGMIQNPRYNDGKPWFIQFRPPVHSPHKILETEMKQYQEYTDKLKLIQQTIQNIQTDTTDLELELKLATTKLKEGHFKMTNIYIESLAESMTKRVKGWSLDSALKQFYVQKEKEKKKPMPKKPIPKEVSKEMKAAKQTKQQAKATPSKEIDTLLSEATKSLEQGHKKKAQQAYLKAHNLYSKQKTKSAAHHKKLMQLYKKLQ